MKKILMAFVVVAMLVGFAMAEEKDIGEMTTLEKYAEARRLHSEGYRESDAEKTAAAGDMYLEIKDSEDLNNNQRAVAYLGATNATYDDKVFAYSLADDGAVIQGQLLAFHLLGRAKGEELEFYIDEAVRLAGRWGYPYENLVIPFLVRRDRLDDAKTVAKAVMGSPRLTASFASRAMSVLEPKEGLDALIGNLPNVRTSATFVPKQDKDGKLVGDSIVTLAMDMVEGNYDKLTYAERTDFRRRIDGQLGMTDPVHIILKQALRSAQEADRKAQELFE